jgi:predicted GTPase
MGRKAFKESETSKVTVAKQAQTTKRKDVDEEFLRLVDESIKKDEKLLRKLAEK